MNASTKFKSGDFVDIAEAGRHSIWLPNNLGVVKRVMDKVLAVEVGDSTATHIYLIPIEYVKPTNEKPEWATENRNVEM